MLRRALFQLTLLAVAVSIILYAATKKVKYYDYDKAVCQVGVALINAELVGAFEMSRPNERGTHYYLRIKEFPDTPESIIKAVSLRSLKSGQIYELGDPIKAPKAKGVYMIRSIALPYESYELSGNVSQVQENSLSMKFSCILKAKFHEERRFPWWDTFMSV